MSESIEPDESAAPGQPQEPTEEEIRAAMEEEMRRIHVGDLILQSVVSLVNIGARRTGTAPGLEAEQDLAQAGIAIEAVRALLPSVEAVSPEQASAVRDALSQLQLAFVKAGGAPAAAPEGTEGGPAEEPSSRIWTPPGS